MNKNSLAPIYQTERWGEFQYTIPVANLRKDFFEVELHFAEIYFNTPNSRKFDVTIEGKKVLDDLDIFQEAGGKFKPLVKTFTTQDINQDGYIDLVFTKGSKDNPKISAIQILGLDMEPCAAYAGTLRPNNTPGCLSNEVFLKVRDQAPPVIPQGYRRDYLLTQGNDLVIQRMDDRPVFGVRQSGLYTVHSLVYDPQTLDPLDFAGQPAALLLAYLADKKICAALDVGGQAFNIATCSPPPLNLKGSAELYPNPASDQVTLKLEHVIPGTYQLQLLSTDMKLVHKQTYTDPGRELQIPVRRLSEGLYYLLVRLPEGEFQSYKVILRR